MHAFGSGLVVGGRLDCWCHLMHQDFPTLEPLYFVLKTLLADKALDNPYTGGCLLACSFFSFLLDLLWRPDMHFSDEGSMCMCVNRRAGLSSFGLLLLVTRFLQHMNMQRKAASSEAASSSHGLGQLLSEFLDYFGNQFDPRAIGISIGPARGRQLGG